MVQLRPAFIGVVAAMLTVSALAQSPAERPAFEVASVKPNRSASGSLTPPPHNTYLAENFTVRMLIRNAYGVTPAEMSGGPSWIDSDRVDVRAKYAEGASREKQSRMLASLLEDRFDLQTHTELRSLHVYELVLVHDGRLGPQLTPSARDCATEPAVTREALIQAHDTLVPPCGMGLMGNQRVTASAQEMWQLVTGLSRFPEIARPVIDNTGLTGRFDYDLSWASLSAGSNAAQAGPSIFVALEEQLGLRLKPVDGMRSVLVIDHIARPTED